MSRFKKIVNLDLKRDEKILNFNDFQKQNIKFDIKNFKKHINKLLKLKNLMMVVAYLTLAQFA